MASAIFKSSFQVNASFRVLFSVVPSSTGRASCGAQPRCSSSLLILALLACSLVTFKYQLILAREEKLGYAQYKQFVQLFLDTVILSVILHKPRKETSITVLTHNPAVFPEKSTLRLLKKCLYNFGKDLRS